MRGRAITLPSGTRGRVYNFRRGGASGASGRGGSGSAGH